jgi:hypothetical protein
LDKIVEYILAYGGQILGSTQLSLMPQLPRKMALALKVVKRECLNMWHTIYVVLKKERAKGQSSKRQSDYLQNGLPLIFKKFRWKLLFLLPWTEIRTEMTLQLAKMQELLTFA